MLKSGYSPPAAPITLPHRSALAGSHKPEMSVPLLATEKSNSVASRALGEKAINGMQEKSDHNNSKGLNKNSYGLLESHTAYSWK